MNNPQLIEEDKIKLYFAKGEFVLSTLQQLNKDFNRELFSAEHSELELREILIILSQHLNEVDKTGGLYPLLYRIDLNEKLAHESLASKDAYMNLAYLVLRREAQKVYLRKLYGNHQ